VTGMASVDVDLLMVTFDWSFVHLTLPVIVTTSIVFCFNKIQNGNILVLANPGPLGKVALKMEREERVIPASYMYVYN